MSDKRQTLTICVLLALAAALVYSPALGFRFVNYDDEDFVLNNTMVQQGLSMQTIGWAFKTTYWLPLTWISYLTDYSLYRLNPSGYHFTNLLLHSISTALLFLALKRMTGAIAGTAMVAALFALHPLHVESVAWIAERKGVLSGLFWMLALVAYASYARRPRPVAYVLVLLCYALGLMSKSMVITLPCVLLLLDFWPLRRILAQPRSAGGSPPSSLVFPSLSVSRALLEKMPFLLLAVGSAISTILSQKHLGAILSSEMIPLPQRLAQTVICYVLYLKKTVWPNDLCVFYPNRADWPGWQVALCALVLIAVTLFVVQQRKLRPYLIVGWLWYLGTLFPVIGLFQTGEQSMADRYSYLPLIGIFIMVVFAAAELLGPQQSVAGAEASQSNARPPQSAMPVVALALAVLVACVLMTSRQLQTWRNTKALFLQADRVTRDNYLANTVLGRISIEEGRLDEAVARFEAALRVQPYYTDTHFGLADALMAKKDYAGAIEHYNAALKPAPNHIQIRRRLSEAYEASGQTNLAAAEYLQIGKIAPGLSQFELDVAGSMQAQRRISEALQHYRLALKLNPNDAAAWNNAAWLLATTTNAAVRNGAEAVSCAERACSLTDRKTPVFLGTLAAAYAEAGNFGAAVKTAEEARDKATAQRQAEIAARNSELLQLYRSGKAYHE